MIQGELFSRNDSGHGGRREGAGRKPGPNAGAPHTQRAPFKTGVVHVTARVLRGVRSLRRRKLVSTIEGCLREGCERERFRVTHYSIQHDHIHYVVEAEDQKALSEGMHGLHVRVAHAVNRVLGRHGRVFAERFHTHLLRTPSEVRNAIRYVLNNARKHGPGCRADSPAIDPASSGRWFEPWADRGWPMLEPKGPDPPAVARPRFWLLTVGWLRRGVFSPYAVPGSCERSPGSEGRRSLAGR